MKTDKLIILIIAVISVAVLIGGVFLLNNQSSPANKPAALSSLDSLVGKPAPDFTLESYNGKKITLSSLKGKNVVLFFSEGLMCYPACWDQIAAFAKDKQFLTKDVIAVSIINDPKSDWKQAIDKMPQLAPATVLFDTDKLVAATYNTLSLPSSMHKGSLPGHTYVVVDKKGIVRYVYDDPSMAIRNQQILAEINRL